MLERAKGSNFANVGDFADVGDAGAWVLSSQGLIGMIWGTSGAGSVYVTPIQVLIDDIEKMTGMRVSFP